MKNLRSILLGLALLGVCGAAKANPAPTALTKNYVINTYIDAMTRGRLSGMSDVIDQNAKFNILRDKKVVSFSKKEMLDYLKSNKNVEMECTTNTSIVDSNADITLVRVDMKYNNSLCRNYITMVNTGSGGWKITNVYSVFK
jgi:Putative lumazine-binding